MKTCPICDNDINNCQCVNPLTPFQKVKKFHKKFNQFIGKNGNIPKEEFELGIRLIMEEFLELHESLAILNPDGLPANTVEFVDAVVDLIFVLYGMLVRLGLDGDYLFDVVWQANMKKVGGGKREDGKVLKPEGWQPPQEKIQKHLIQKGVLK